MIRLVADIGSWLTKIGILGCGVVLSEATCVALQSDISGNVTIKAYGDTARALSGKAAQNTRIINPVCEGEIVQPALLCELLKYFLEKIEVTPRKAKQAEVMFILPCSATKKLRKTYLKIAEDCGIGRTYFTRTPFAAVLGHNVTLSKTSPVFCVDVGYGKTDISVFSLDGIISGFTANLGGGNIDVHIMDLLCEEFGIKVGALTAEKLKNVVGSLYEGDNKMMAVIGRSVKNGEPTQAAVNSSHLEEVIKLYVDKIIEYVRAVLADLPAEVSSAVVNGGIYLSGGLTKMDGFAEYFGKGLEIKVNVCEEPSLASVIGGCTVLSSPYLCSKIATVN
ncbi:MAG: rod shape-determining protein [Clostridiales bacterium]|nr:rod shape-determining protein [Clostridiales bacterium]